MRLTPFAALCLAAWAAGPHAAAAQTVENQAGVCAGCHGAAGQPADPSVPVIWGQNADYVELELRDFKAGTRKGEIMGQVALDLEAADMHALAAYFAAKTWPDPGGKAAPADIAQRAETIDASEGCQNCHQAQWRGNGAVPRLAGQSAAYLRATMRQFRSGARANNPVMAMLMKTLGDADIDAVAQYLAER